MLLARIIITPRPVLNDPQGRAVQRALETLGFDEAQDVRVGKYLEVTLDLESRARAETRVKEMCDRLLANQVIEDYRYEIAEAPKPAVKVEDDPRFARGTPTTEAPSETETQDTAAEDVPDPTTVVDPTPPPFDEDR